MAASKQGSGSNARRIKNSCDNAHVDADNDDDDSDDDDDDNDNDDDDRNDVDDDNEPYRGSNVRGIKNPQKYKISQQCI